MESIHTAKYIIGKYYPRSHLLVASALSLLLISVVFFGAEQPAHGTLMSAADQERVIDPDASDISLSEAATLQATNQVTGDAATVDPLPNATEVDDNIPTTSSWTDVVVQPGDNLSALFTRVGLSATDLHRLLESSDDDTALNRLQPGYELSFHMPEPGQLQQLQVLTSPLDGHLYTRHDDGYEVEPIQREAQVTEAFRHGKIDDSLFMASQRAGIPVRVTMEMANIFGGVIDFILDPRRGDEFSILYEEQHLDGNSIGTGDIIAARFINRDREYIALRYEKADGETGYFNPEGESMRKAFLRNPMEVFRISSNFNPNRRHPILNTIRAHKGTDYAAPRGTPVRATADGTVTWAARNGSFGNLVVIKHNGSFETKYAHLNGYASGISKGARVEQGEVIGYVGTTGGATGPHLHYEFLVDGVHRNPRTILDELPQAVSLAESELPRFREQTRDALERFREQHREQQLLLSYNPDDDDAPASSHD
ncbi:MAG: peptidoglycan DD-metalloendopeptidase family protein [Pseudohongiellaceae bacterium]